MHTHNAFGLSLVELCCAFDIHIMNGILFDDTEGNFTCFANNGVYNSSYLIGIKIDIFYDKVKFCNLGFSIGKNENSGIFRNYCSQ